MTSVFKKIMFDILKPRLCENHTNNLSCSQIVYPFFCVLDFILFVRADDFAMGNSIQSKAWLQVPEWWWSHNVGETWRTNGSYGWHAQISIQTTKVCSHKAALSPDIQLFLYQLSSWNPLLFVCRSMNEIKNLHYLPRANEPREVLFEDRTRAHADHVGQGFDWQSTAAVGVLKAVHFGEWWVGLTIC